MTHKTKSLWDSLTQSNRQHPVLSIQADQRLNPVSLLLSQDLLLLCVEAIKEEVVIHSRSESETKDNELINGIINRIDVDVVIVEVEPLVMQLPAGFMLIMILKAIRSYTKKQIGNEQD